MFNKKDKEDKKDKYSSYCEGTCANIASTVPWGARSTTDLLKYSTPSYATPDVERMIHEIYERVCGQLTPFESVRALVLALEDMRCPVDSCKNCKYYTPGSVEVCDTNRHIAEYLVESGIVKVFERKS